MVSVDEEQEALTKQAIAKAESRYKTNPLRDMSPMMKLLLAAGVFIVVWFYFGKDMPESKRIILLAALGIGFIILMGMGEQAPKLLEEQEIVNMLYDKLRWKQLHHHGGVYQIKQGTIIIDIQGKRVPVRWGGNPYFWEHGFKVIPTNKPIFYQYSAEQDCYNGDILAVKDRFEGYTGRETLEKDFVATENLQKELLIEKWKKEGKTGKNK